MTRSSKRVSPRFSRLGVSRFSRGCSRTNNFFFPPVADDPCEARAISRVIDVDGIPALSLDGWPYIAKCLSLSRARICTRTYLCWVGKKAGESVTWKEKESKKEKNQVKERERERLRGNGRENQNERESRNVDSLSMYASTFAHTYVPRCTG